MFSMLRKIPLAKINDVCFVERVTVIFRCRVFYAIMPSYIKQENHMLIAHFSLKKKMNRSKLYLVLHNYIRYEYFRYDWIFSSLPVWCIRISSEFTGLTTRVTWYTKTSLLVIFKMASLRKASKSHARSYKERSQVMIIFLLHIISQKCTDLCKVYEICFYFTM